MSIEDALEKAALEIIEVYNSHDGTTYMPWKYAAKRAIAAFLREAEATGDDVLTALVKAGVLHCENCGRSMLSRLADEVEGATR